MRPRQDRGDTSQRRGEAEAALLLPRGEAFASRHTSLCNTGWVVLTSNKSG